MALPTPTSSYSTACIPVSYPASTYTRQHSSGEWMGFPFTTLTAPTTRVYTDPATIRVTCFTPSPGETIIPELPYLGVTCSTTYYPESTETVTRTYTPGETTYFWDYTGTTTSYRTATYTYEARTYVYCDPLPDVENPATCDKVTPLTWASLIITFISVQLSWWLFDVPLLWKKKKSAGDDELRGFAGFIQTVIWACIRVNAPGSAALFALKVGEDTREYAAMYYLGVRRNPNGSAPQFTKLKLSACVGFDVISLVASGLTIYQACTLPEFSPKRFGSSLWAYPSLPTALNGLCLLIGYKWFPRSQKATRWLIFMMITVVVLVGTVLGLILWRFATTDGLWFLSVLLYGFMAFPVAVLPRCFTIVPALACGLYARVGGVFSAALLHYAGGEPYCKMRGVGFAVVYITLGGISSLFALFGILTHASEIRYTQHKLRKHDRSREMSR